MLTKMISDDRLEMLVHQSFMAEVNAYKPGNVSCYSAGHGMAVEDFIVSADVSAPLLVQKNLGLGERILRAVEATQARVHCNTNLGMLLLYAPIIVTIQRLADTFKGLAEFQLELMSTLQSLDIEQSKCVYQAIALANPGGLGASARYDVRDHPETHVLDVMRESESRDRIAWQYTHGYEEVINIGYCCINDWAQRGNSVECAIVYTYLCLLKRIPDSHIGRKFGQEIAKQSSVKAAELLESILMADSKKEIMANIQALDKEFKVAGINPGTTADLTAASALLYLMIDNGLITTD